MRFNTGRRQFIKTGMALGAGLSLGMHLLGKAETKVILNTTSTLQPFSPNAFIRISTDNQVIILMKHLEMGQGSHTGLATLVAEELDAAWSQVRVESAPADAERYSNLSWGVYQGTGGSTAMANSFMQMRKAGALARQMLLQAAAKKWQVDEQEISIKEGLLSTTKQRASFGEMANFAAQETIPEEVFLKDADQFRLIGQDRPRLDSHDKIYGTARYTQDVILPGLLTAVVQHPPRFGATVKSVQGSAAKAIAGVVQIVTIPGGVAVLAKDFWSAKKGREALQVEWNQSDAFRLGSDEIMAHYKTLAKTPGSIARQQGNAQQALQKASQTLTASYEFPYLAHAAMEPMNCVMQRHEHGCEVWNGEQLQTLDQHKLAQRLGLKPAQIKINMLYAGGSFGRRANPNADYLLETADILKASQRQEAIKLVWTREDDMQAGYYRPMFLHQLSVGLDAKGYPSAWHHRLVGQSILADTPFAGSIQHGIDPSSVEGVADLPYPIPHITVELHTPKLPIPVQWWRSVGSTHTAFVVETMIDELAEMAGKDPLVYRRTLLQAHPRHRTVMELAAKQAGWDKPLPAGKGRGIAVHESFNTYVAQVAEVTVHADHTFDIDRVIIAVDCGIAINPDIIRTQMEGGMVFGLSAALNGKITLKDGQVEQANFDGYPVLRMAKMPPVTVHIVKSTQPPSGVGEPSTPVIAPAIANALAKATGKRFRRLPLQNEAGTLFSENTPA